MKKKISVLAAVLLAMGCVACGYEGPCVQRDDVEMIRAK